MNQPNIKPPIMKPPIMKQAVTFMSILLLTACGGGGGSSSDGGGTGGSGDPEPILTLDLKISPNLSVNASTSYEAQKSEFRLNRRYGFENMPMENFSGAFHGVAYGDFDADGDIDFQQSGSNLTDKTRPHFYRQNDAGQFIQEDSFIVGGEGLIHPRKSIVADFNNDNIPDVVNFGHGLDHEPFPGEVAELYLSNGTQLTFSDQLSGHTGYFHCGAAGDIDNDGDIDILIGDANNDGFYFLINDGNANFVKASDRIASNTAGFTCELIDVNKDGYLDLLKGGHEFQGTDTAIYYGNSTGTYSAPVILPAKAQFGVVLDIDAEDTNDDGFTDLVILRTGDNTTNPLYLYTGFYVQLFHGSADGSFSDQSSLIERRTDWAYGDNGNPGFARGVEFNGNVPSGGNNIDWIDWIRVQDVNDDNLVDIIEDQRFRNITWLNNGDGTFSSQFIISSEEFNDYQLYE